LFELLRRSPFSHTFVCKDSYYFEIKEHFCNFQYIFFPYLCHQRWRNYSVSAKKRMDSFVLRSTFRISAIKDGEITPSRQKKRMDSFVLRSTFRNFGPE